MTLPPEPVAVTQLLLSNEFWSCFFAAAVVKIPYWILLCVSVKQWKTSRKLADLKWMLGQLQNFVFVLEILFQIEKEKYK